MEVPGTTLVCCHLFVQQTRPTHQFRFSSLTNHSGMSASSSTAQRSRSWSTARRISNQLLRQLALLLQVAMCRERCAAGWRRSGPLLVADKRAASGAVLDDRGDELFAASDGSSERVVRPPVGIVFPGAANQRVSLLPVALGECERLCGPPVMLAGLLDSRIRWHEPRSRSAGSAERRRTRRCRACPHRSDRRW